MKKLSMMDGIRYTMNAAVGLLWTELYYLLNKHVSDAVNYWLLSKIQARATWCVETEPFATVLAEDPRSMYNMMYIIEFTEDEKEDLLKKNL